MFVGVPPCVRRLVYLASLRDEKTGRYDGSQLAELRGKAEADLVLSELHEEVFGTWLSFSLEDQDGVERSLIPAQAGAAERENSFGRIWSSYLAH